MIFMCEPVPLDPIPTRPTLLRRLKDSEDNESWREFFNTYWRLIFEVALKAGLSETEAEEVVQETMISVAKKMPTFQYDPAQGAFKGWLLNLTRWRIVDRLRRRPLGDSDPVPVNPEQATRTSFLERIPDQGSSAIESIWNEEWKKNLMEVALEKLKHEVKPKQYQIFELYVLQKWPVQKVASTLGVSIGHIYIIKHRLMSLLKKQLKKLEEQWPG